MSGLYSIPIIVVLVVQGVICGAFAAFLANQKGYSDGAWFICGFLFSIIGVIAAAGLPMTDESEMDVSTLTKECPECAETIRLPARVCRFCGERFGQDRITADLWAIIDGRDSESAVYAIGALMKQEAHGLKIDKARIHTRLEAIMAMAREGDSSLWAEADDLLKKLPNEDDSANQAMSTQESTRRG